MAQTLSMAAGRLLVAAWLLVAVLAAFVAVLWFRPWATSTALPTVRSLGMPIPRAALDRTLSIGAHRGVTAVGTSRLEIDSRYGQFRGHWWWDHGWVYVSGSVLPGTRIHVHLDAGSLTVSEAPGPRAVSQLGRYGRDGFVSIVQVNVVRFGVDLMLVSNTTTGGPFAGRHVLDQIDGRAWTERGLTITRVHVASSPAHAVPCAAVVRSPNAWELGCQFFGQRPLVSDRRGQFTALSPSLPEAKAVSLTITRNAQTRLPADSMRTEW